MKLLDDELRKAGKKKRQGAEGVSEGDDDEGHFFLLRPRGVDFMKVV